MYHSKNWQTAWEVSTSYNGRNRSSPFWRRGLCRLRIHASTLCGDRNFRRVHRRSPTNGRRGASRWSSDEPRTYLPVALSIMVSFVSAVSIIGVPAEIYVFDTMYCWSLISAIIGNALICVLFIPVYFRLRMTSIYEASFEFPDKKQVPLADPEGGAAPPPPQKKKWSTIFFNPIVY